MNELPTEKDARIAELERAVAELKGRLAGLQRIASERELRITGLNQAQAEFRARIVEFEGSLLGRVSSWLRRRRPHYAPPAGDACLAVPLDYRPVGWETAPGLAVVCHVFYADMAQELRRYFLNIPFPFDLFVTTDSDAKKAEIERTFASWTKGTVEVRIAPNRGRDIAPKLIACRDVYDRYEFVLHAHAKKSPHQELQRGWREYLLETLLGSEEIVRSVFEAFRADSKLGMAAPQHYGTVRPRVGWGWNFEIARALARRMGFDVSLDGRVDFPSGSMFWARSAALRPLLDAGLTPDDFPPEAGQLDGTMSHAIERLYFFACERAGRRWIKLSAPALHGDADRARRAGSREALAAFIKESQYRLLEPSAVRPKAGVRP